MTLLGKPVGVNLGVPPLLFLDRFFCTNVWCNWLGIIRGLLFLVYGDIALRIRIFVNFICTL